MPHTGAMPLNLFDSRSELEKLQLPDADIGFILNFYDSATAKRHFDALLQEVPWRQDSIRIAGMERLQPRLTAWYGDAATHYTYSGLKLAPLPWSPLLSLIRSEVENACGRRFNSVLLNLYRNERDSVGWHSDDEPELGMAPFIASLSLGETRRFKLKHKHRKDAKTTAFDLEHGSLLLMGGATQENWLHAVEKESTVRNPRINLTFRTITARPGKQ